MTDFVVGWRGFLVGNRRDWHAHHRWGVSGFRGGTLLVRRAVQLGQLRAAAGVLADVFARGGSVWLFGGAVRGNPAWGRVRPEWRPGALSNYFFARLKRTHFVRRLSGVFYPTREVRRRTGLATRWLRRRREGHLAGYPVRHAGFTRVLARLTTGAVTSGPVGYVRAPRGGRRRTRWVRAWWVRTGGPAPRRGGHPGGVPPGRVIAPAARAVRHAQAVRTGRVRPERAYLRGGVTRPDRPVSARTGRPVPARGVRRHQRWPLGFPSVVVTSGTTLLKSTLLNEVNAAGLPFVRFGGVDLVPRSALFEVYWNGTAPAGAGLPGWLNDLFVRSGRAGLFRTCWRRLTRLAER